MSNMIISPMQNEYVTKYEFNEFAERVEERFEEQKSYTDQGFDKVFKHIDAVETNLGKKIDDFRVEVNSRFVAIDKKFDAMDVRLTLLTKVTNKIAEKIL